jgi:hypothetical protein
MSFSRSKQTFIEFLLQGLYSSRRWILHEQQSLLLIAADFVRRKTQSTQAICKYGFPDSITQMHFQLRRRRRRRKGRESWSSFCLEIWRNVSSFKL